MKKISELNSAEIAHEIVKTRAILKRENLESLTRKQLEKYLAKLEAAYRKWEQC